MGRFGHSDRWSLDYATPRRQYVVVRRHGPWTSDLLFVVSYFTCVLTTLFVATLIAHLVISALLV